MSSFLERARDRREQPLFHAVGDQAIDDVLTALESSGGEAWRPLRPRIEHGDMLEPAHFERAKKLGVIVVQNPSHFMLPAVMASRLGARTARVTMMKSMIAAGVPVALGSDGPLNPYLNLMFASINANNPAEAMTREQAISAYTLGSARAEMMETQKGTLAPGMLADLAILSQDIFTAPPDALPGTFSVLTMSAARWCTSGSRKGLHDAHAGVPMPCRSLALVALAALAIPPVGLAQAPPPARLLEPARVYDGTAMHEGWGVVVRGRTIEAAGPLAALTLPAGAERVVAGRAHAHARA